MQVLAVVKADFLQGIDPVRLSWLEVALAVDDLGIDLPEVVVLYEELISVKNSQIWTDDVDILFRFLDYLRYLACYCRSIQVSYHDIQIRLSDNKSTLC